MWPTAALCVKESHEDALENCGILWDPRDIPLWAFLTPCLPPCSAAVVCKWAGHFL